MSPLLFSALFQSKVYGFVLLTCRALIMRPHIARFWETVVSSVFLAFGDFLREVCMIEVPWLMTSERRVKVPCRVDIPRTFPNGMWVWVEGNGGWGVEVVCIPRVFRTVNRFLKWEDWPESTTYINLWVGFLEWRWRAQAMSRRR